MIVFAHLSDPHFGPVLVAPSGLIPGQFPHSTLLCELLREGLADAGAVTGLGEHDPIHVVASGDLTVSGKASEFTVTHTFIRSRHRIRREPPGNFMGLDVNDALLGTVPGNHDHWDGQQLWPGTPSYSPQAIFEDHFRQTPWHKTWSRAGVDLDLFGIDSNSGLLPGSANPWAFGSISSSELEKLEAFLGARLALARRSSTPRIRVIVCHHSPTYDGGIRGTETLDPKSKRLLLELACRYEVAAILTGHTHTFHPKGYMDPSSLAPIPKLPCTVWEFRSPSTVQDWSRVFRRRPPLRGFWVHRVQHTAGTMKWASWQFIWDGARFQYAGRTGPGDSTPLVEFDLP